MTGWAEEFEMVWVPQSVVSNLGIQQTLHRS
jgi:hypothetical protein